MKNSFAHFRLLFIAFVFCYSVQILPQNRTVGIFINDTAKTFKGYTLLAPKLYTSTYLITNEGRIVNKWTKCIYPPGQSVYILPNGHLLRSCMTKGALSSGGGEGGRIEEYTWNDSLVWSFDYSTANYMSHHDIRPLPNGNIIFLAVEKKSIAELLAAGFDTSKFQPEIKQRGYMLPDYVAEVKPSYPSGGTIVWEWHTWDHLIQDLDASKLNYGIVANHPELIDADGDGKQLPCFWNHMNSVTYNPKYDQVMMSVRGNSEIWIVDHSTSTAQAASHTGGKYGKGGDLLYRWGNPACYKAGTASVQKLFQQHDAEWIDSTCPGAGNITVFNNGLGRNYSTIEEIVPPVDANGNYAYTTGSPFGPANATWTYAATPPTSLYATAISGAQRLPNGNTLICDGTHGTLTEVTTAGLIVWKYINPVTSAGALTQGDTITDDPTHPGEKLNMVFRAQRYSPTHPGLQGRTLVPGDFIEIIPVSIKGETTAKANSFVLHQNYPNPFNPVTTITFELSESSAIQLNIYNSLGKRIETLATGEYKAGLHSLRWNGEQKSSGVYFCELLTSAGRKTIKLILMK
ncbi:MAG: aryl-sulfate sulfotransferase [Ignavibacteria bacterium]|nr:aryl-sulfate sulfotransferase [Ignavibacteria bacterium]